MNCPVCGRKVKSEMTIWGQNYTKRCECGTRLFIKVGIFHDKIIDWQKIEEQTPSSRLL